MTDLNVLAGEINLAVKSLYNALKYIYLISDEDFYNISVRDLFKVALNDVSNPDSISNLGLRLVPEKIGEMSEGGFEIVERIIRYSFAVRIPFLRKDLDKLQLTNGDMKSLYTLVGESGIENPDGLIELDFKTAYKLSKSRDEEPFFDAEWFKRWVYAYSRDLGAINNRNLFLLGCVDALFPLYYSTLFERLVNIVKNTNT